MQIADTGSQDDSTGLSHEPLGHLRIRELRIGYGPKSSFTSF
jgi:hypothetical protein